MIRRHFSSTLVINAAFHIRSYRYRTFRHASRVQQIAAVYLHIRHHKRSHNFFLVIHHHNGAHIRILPTSLGIKRRMIEDQTHVLPLTNRPSFFHKPIFSKNSLYHCRCFHIKRVLTRIIRQGHLHILCQGRCLFRNQYQSNIPTPRSLGNSPRLTTPFLRGLHLVLKALGIQRQSRLFGHKTCQVHRKAHGIVEEKGFLAGYHLGIGGG
mmetsp:Transcript_41954/g.48995  ORF Transcript_41954/g.48995 Transcript_41954/m.48995 type:complete len:210 (-) Transcript_41954:1583-2212(-)